MASPRVSVIVPTRNRPELLERALRSVAAQSWTDYEVLVVDDGSTPDALVRYVDLWHCLDGRFRLVGPPVPGAPGIGPAAARNCGARVACGYYLAFLDDDDYWTARDHLAVAVATMDRTAIDFYFANLVSARESEVIISNWYRHYPQLCSGQRLNTQPDVFRVDHRKLAPLMRHSSLHLDTTVVRRDLFARVGGFCERLRYGEDYNLFLRLADAASVACYRPDPVARYHLPAPGSASAITGRDQALQMLTATQHARAVCTSPIVRRMARARESWYLRQLARETSSISFGWQSFCTFPTMGGLVLLARLCLRAIAHPQTP